MPTPTTVRLRGKAVFDEGKALAQNYKHTVIDAGGRDNAGLHNAFLLADLAIVPTGTSGFDAAAMTDLLEVHEVAADYNPDLRLKMLLTRIDPHTKDDQEMLKFLQEYKLDVLASSRLRARDIPTCNNARFDDRGDRQRRPSH